MDKDGYHGYYKNERPPQRKWLGLTYEEQGSVYGSIHEAPRTKPFWVSFADAIEAKLKEKNT
jgi:hypothetical protein